MQLFLQFFVIHTRFCSHSPLKAHKGHFSDESMQSTNQIIFYLFQRIMNFSGICLHKYTRAFLVKLKSALWTWRDDIIYSTCVFGSLIINFITDASSTLRMLYLKLMAILIVDGQKTTERRWWKDNRTSWTSLEFIFPFTAEAKR